LIRSIKWGKRMNTIADGLTIIRGVFVLVILLTGGFQGADSLPKVVILTVICWVTDVLDGKLARQSENPTHLGRYDVVADLGLALSLAICLILWEIVSALPVVVVIVLAMVSTLVFRFSAPQKFAMGMAYAGLMVTVLQKQPHWIWVLLGGLVFLVFLNPKRARQQVSDFLSEVESLFVKKNSDMIENFHERK